MPVDSFPFHQALQQPTSSFCQFAGVWSSDLDEVHQCDFNTRHYFPNCIEQSSDMTSPLSTQLSCFSFCCYQDWISADSSVFSTLCPSVQKQKVWLSDCCDSAFYTNSQQCSFWSSKSNYFSSTFLEEVAFKSLICCLCMLSMIGSDT